MPDGPCLLSEMKDGRTEGPLGSRSRSPSHVPRFSLMPLVAVESCHRPSALRWYRVRGSMQGLYRGVLRRACPERSLETRYQGRGACACPPGATHLRQLPLVWGAGHEGHHVG